jgi:hypothetical protein
MIPMRCPMKLKVLPFKEFLEWGGLVLNRNETISYRSGVEEIITKFENWSDYYEYSRHQSGFGTNGYRMMMKRDFLLSFLLKENMSLILECDVRRSSKEGSRSANYSKLYLLNGNGTIESISGNIKTR